MRPGGDKPLGGVVLTQSAEHAEELCRAMLGNVLVTKQTGPAGSRGPGRC